MSALIIVDIQNDFMPGGALAVKEGEMILPAINQLMIGPFDTIVATKDWHPLQHMSFASTYGKKVGEVIEVQGILQILWPDHCVQETWGAQFAPGWPSDKVDEVILKGTFKEVDSYSTFFDNARGHPTGLEDYLRQRNIKTLYLAGLTLEYCILYSALDARKLGFEVFVVKEGCKGVELQQGNIAKAYEDLQKAGVQVISIADRGGGI